MYFRGQKQKGFTIVELLIVIVVIAVLAAITVVAFTAVQQRAATTKRDADLAQYYKAILVARERVGNHLYSITTSTYSSGSCTHSTNNPAAIEPRDLAKSHVCWTRYYDNLTRIGQAAGVNLDNLRSGDSRGNPYTFDENEGETACPARDTMFSFTGSGVNTLAYRSISRFDGCA